MMRYVTISKASEMLGRSESDVRYYVQKGVLVNNGALVEEGSVQTLKQSLKRDSDAKESLRKILECKESFEAVMKDYKRCEAELKDARMVMVKDLRLMGYRYKPEKLLRLILETVGERVLNKKEMYVMENLSAYDDLGELGASVGLTRERVRQLFERAVNKIGSYDMEAEYNRYMEIEEENDSLRKKNEELLKEVARLKGTLGSKEKACIAKGKNLRDYLTARKVTEYDLSTRTKNFLVANDIESVADLVGYTQSQLMRLPRCGNVTLSDMSRVLSSVSQEVGANVSLGMSFE